MMTTAEIIDNIFMILAIALATWYVIRWNLFGIILAVLSFIIISFIDEQVILNINQTRISDMPLLEELAFGSLTIALYACVVLIIKKVVSWVIQKRKLAIQPTLPPPPYQSPDTQDHPEEVNKQ